MQKSKVQGKIKNEEVQDSEKQQLEQRVQEIDNKYKRALADYQNLEKRIREDRVNWIKSASKELLLRLLPVLDTLELASKHSEDKSLQVSVQLFLDTLKNEGVTRIPTEGKDFDPNTMEVINTKEGEEGKVLEEVRSGYMLHDQVLRVAQVIVGKGS